MPTILIGIDDTDNKTSPGTGRLARGLFEVCAERRLDPVGITRQQFLVDDRIPYTSRNSGACVVVKPEAGESCVAFAFDFVAERAAAGSDPGVCVARLDAVPPEVVAFGKRAATEVVEMSEALELARAAGIELRALGGTEIGVIGALGSVGLHAGGNHGRFIQLPGLRDLADRVGPDDITRLGVRLEHRGDRVPKDDDVYQTLGWVRPRLLEGEPVLPVAWSDENHAWLPVDRKRHKPVA